MTGSVGSVGPGWLALGSPTPDGRLVTGAPTPTAYQVQQQTLAIFGQAAGAADEEPTFDEGGSEPPRLGASFGVLFTLVDCQHLGVRICALPDSTPRPSKRSAWLCSVPILPILLRHAGRAQPATARD